MTCSFLFTVAIQHESLMLWEKSRHKVNASFPINNRIFAYLTNFRMWPLSLSLVCLLFIVGACSELIFVPSGDFSSFFFEILKFLKLNMTDRHLRNKLMKLIQYDEIFHSHFSARTIPVAPFSSNYTTQPQWPKSKIIALNNFHRNIDEPLSYAFFGPLLYVRGIIMKMYSKHEHTSEIPVNPFWI